MEFKKDPKEIKFPIVEALKLEPDKDAPEFHPSANSSRQTIELFESIMESMQDHSKRGRSIASFILAGEPGTGKTARVNLFSKILGVSLITIEAPHLIEENIINIPYLVLDNKTGAASHKSTTLKGSTSTTVVMADSHLLSTMQMMAAPISDKLYLQNIYNSSDDIISIYEQLDGTRTKIPVIIQELRKTYTVILFLDEFLRKINPRIRNMLRGILDGKIGTDKMPRYVYPIYATNIEDEGLETISSNMEFNQIELENPTKKEWFSFFVNKYNKSKNVRLHMPIVNEFFHELEDNHMSFVSNSIRTSPRRWEQLLLYINSSLPVKDEKEATDLLTNVKTNFRLYLKRGREAGSHSVLADPVLEIVCKLIQKTSNITVNKNAVNAISNWRETLNHQIQQKIKLGEDRTYVPVISGLPGIGKTSEAHHVATSNNLRFIDINVSTINAEDVIGIATAKELPDGGIQTVFSLPVLYTLIMKKIKEEDELYFVELEKKFPKDFEEKIEKYKDQPYKYLIFLDELNRNTPKVFNSIRRVLLEKNFGLDEKHPGKLLELPKECIMMAAINPRDDGDGVNDLTKHMQDVLDIIETGPSWDKALDHMKSDKIEDVSNSAHDEAINVLELFVDKHKITSSSPNFEKEAKEIPHSEKPFFLEIGAKLIYFSPRVYSNTVYGIGRTLDNQFKKIKKMNLAEITPQEKQELLDKLREGIAKNLKERLSFALTKNQMLDNKAFWDKTKYWVTSRDSSPFTFPNLFSQDVVDTKDLSFEELFDDAFEGRETQLHEDLIFTNYLKHTSEPVIGQTIRDAILSKINDRASLEKYVLQQTHPAKFYNEKTYQIEGDSKKKVCLLINLVRLVGIACDINGLGNEYFDAFRRNATAFTTVIGPNSEKIPKKLHIRDKSKTQVLDELYGNTDHFVKPGQTPEELKDEMATFFVEEDPYGFSPGDYKDLIR